MAVATELDAAVVCAKRGSEGDVDGPHGLFVGAPGRASDAGGGKGVVTPRTGA